MAFKTNYEIFLETKKLMCKNIIKFAIVISKKIKNFCHIFSKKILLSKLLNKHNKMKSVLYILNNYHKNKKLVYLCSAHTTELILSFMSRR